MTTNVHSSQVKELRDITGAGMMDCKQALLETGGDIEKAKDYLRKKGVASADKRASKEAKDGMIFIQNDGKTGAMAEVNSETDFVARTDDFQKLGAAAVKAVAEKGEAAIESDAIQTQAKEVSGKIGEKISVRRAVRFQTNAGLVVSYRHHNQKIGVMVELAFSNAALAQNAEVEKLGKDIAMQSAALRAPFLSKDQVSAEFLEREKSIFRDQVKDKPANVQDKIIDGKLQKRFEEVCLLEQKSVIDPAKSIAQLVDALGKKLGSPITVKRFQRFEIGT